jgi:hypothetical protein
LPQYIQQHIVGLAIAHPVTARACPDCPAVLSRANR